MVRKPLAILCLFGFLLIPIREAMSDPMSPQHIFYDYRKERPSFDAAMDPKLEQKILRQAFKRSFLKSLQECKTPGSLELENDIETGQFSPSVSSRLQGSFTRTGVQETAYLIFVGECSGGRNFHSHRLAIFSGDHLVFQQNVEGNDLIKKTDLNGNGLDELLLEGGGMGLGVLEVYAKLIEINQGQVKMLHDFGMVSTNDCGALEQGNVWATVILAQPISKKGSLPHFEKKAFKATCSKKKIPLSAFKPTQDFPQ